MIALLSDDTSTREIDLVRALYDADTVDATPPSVPLVAPFEENTSTSDLGDMVGLLVSVHRPFMLELGNAERAYDHDPDTGKPQLLQLRATQGADESQRLAEALYRDVFPHQRPDIAEISPTHRTAMTIGRFRSERDAERAVEELQRKAYFLVVTQVGILEEDEGVWRVRHTMELGGMLQD